MPRFFIPPDAINGKYFTLSGSEAHHAIDVLRHKTCDVIELFDGKDRSYRGKIASVEDGEIRGVIVEESTGEKSAYQLTLYQALTRGPKWDWLLEKACEIGISRVVPILTRRTIVKWDDKPSSDKVSRWNRIAMAASKQSGRSTVMTVEAPLAFPQSLEDLPKSNLSLIPWEKEDTRSIRKALEGYTGQSVSLFIGPEGGWDPSEVSTAQARHILPVKLGPTLLRTETAGLVAATLVFREWNVY